MLSNNLPQWFPNHPPVYDIHKSYLENAEHGPFFKGHIPKRIVPPQEKWIDFLGKRVASRIGIPAGPLLNARWVALAAELGYDVLTYKTIRSAEHPSHPLPNMIYIDTHGMVKHQREAISTARPSKYIEDLAVTNSFGMPSRSPSYLLEDIPRAQNSLKEGQVLIVSIVATPHSDSSFLSDFVAVAHLAKEAGAEIIEANFSCPNVGKKEGMLYMSLDAVKEIGSALVKAIDPIPLVIKIGLCDGSDHLRNLMITAARSGVRAIAGINTVSMHVRDPAGNPALGNRMTSGICGGPIRELALEFTRQAHAINAKEKLDLALISCGGITLPEHFDQFIEAGADIATTATGMLWDPYLAARYKEIHAT